MGIFDQSGSGSPSPSPSPSSPTSPDRLVAFASYIQGEVLPSSHPFNAPALASRLKSLGISFGEKTAPLESLVGCTECDIRRDRLPPLPDLPLLSSPTTTTPSSIPDDSTRGDSASGYSKENEEGHEQEREEKEEMGQRRRGWKSKGTLSTLKKLERELVTLRWIYSLSPSPPPTPTPTRHPYPRETGIENDTLARQWRHIQHCMPLLAAYVRERAKAVKMYRLLGPEGEGGEVILGGGWDGCGWWERATRDPWMSALTSTRASTVAA